MAEQVNAETRQLEHLALLIRQHAQRLPAIHPADLPPVVIGRTINLPMEFPANSPFQNDEDTWDQVLLKELQGLRPSAVPEDLLVNAQNGVPYECAVCFVPMASAIRCQQCTTTGRQLPPGEVPKLSSCICPSCFHDLVKNAIAQQSEVRCPICRAFYEVEDLQYPTLVLLSRAFNF